MTAIARIGLLTILTTTLLGQAASAPSAGQAAVRAAEQQRAAAESAERARGARDDESALLPARDKLASVLGKEVRTRVEEDNGRIIDLLVDRDGRVQAAVIEFGGFLGIGTRKIAVEWSAVRFETDGKQPAIVDVTRDQLRAAPEYRTNEPAVVRRVSD
jgi:PRC-barrel domain